MTTPPPPDRLAIRYVAGEGQLLRILGLIERRGFDLAAVDMRREPGNGARLEATVLARGPGRKLDTLVRQLGRVHGVEQIELISADSQVREQAA